MTGTLLLILLNEEEAPDAGPGILRTYPVGNRGTDDIVVGTITLEQTGSAFAIESDLVSGTTLPPGATSSFKVRFDPSVAGPYLASVRIPSSDRDGALTIALIGEAIDSPVPGITVDPTSFGFGDVDTATGTATQAFTVASSGTGPLTVGTITISGAGFTISADAASGEELAPGTSATVSVTFDPASDGAKTGSLTIPSDAGASVVVALTGTGTTGAPVSPPTSVTRFYLTRQASPVGAIAEGSGWAGVTTDPDHLLSPARGGPVVSASANVNASAGISGQRYRLARFVSPPLAAQALDSAIRCYCIAQRSTYLGSNVTSAIRFGVLRSGVVTWQAILAMGSAVSAWPSTPSPSPRRFAAGDSWTWRAAGTLVDDDQLVVELGFRAFTIDTSPAKIRYGGASTDGDLEATQDPATVDLTLAPWIDFNPGLLVP